MRAPRLDEAVTARYLDSVARLDRRGAVDTALSALDSGVPLETILGELVAAGQAEVGRRWETNEWNVAREHAATSISEEVVAALGARTRQGRARGSVVVTCVEGEWHALPARILAEVLRTAGWDVTYLGASTPAAHLAQLVHDLGPDAVALSCSVSTSLPRARRMIEAAREAGVPVLAGGRGFGADGRYARLLGADRWAATATDAVEVLTQDWPSFTTPAPRLAHPDGDHTEVDLRARELVERAVALLTQRFPPMASYTDEQRARTTEDFFYILDFLATALYVDDPGLFADFVQWLTGLLSARGVPARAVGMSLDILAEVLPTDLGRGHRFLAQGRSAVPDATDVTAS